MARQSVAEQNIPTGIEDVPYPDHRAIAGTPLKHTTDSFAAQITGGGGTGAVLSGIPFNPALVDIYRTTVPLMQRRLANDNQINLITGAAAAANLVVAVDDPAVPSWKVTLTTGLAPDGVDVEVVCTGFRDVGGSI